MVRIFDAQGSFIRTIGEMGLSPGRFALPKGVSVDHEGRVYVVDAATAVVQVFDAEGRLLMFFGIPDKSGPGGLYLPAGVATPRKTLRARATPNYDTKWDDDTDWIAPSSAGARRPGTPVVWQTNARAVTLDDESQDAPRYTAGERVKHARFGTGTIVDISGQGAAVKARIDFDDESIGRKTLMLAQAHLERGWE